MDTLNTIENIKKNESDRGIKKMYGKINWDGFFVSVLSFISRKTRTRAVFFKEAEYLACLRMNENLKDRDAKDRWNAAEKGVMAGTTRAPLVMPPEIIQDVGETIGKFSLK